MQAAEVKIKGIVQGVGFRPFIHRLVREHGLKGTIRNTSSGVTMELEGEERTIADFLDELPWKAPPLAVIEEISSREIPLKGFEAFTIVGSERQNERNTLISPDISICADCLRELRDPADRTFGNSAIRPTGDTAIPLSTVPTADRALRSSRTCPTTGRKLP